MRVFVSHSSKDIDLVTQLVDLMRSALLLSADDIRCTSLEGYKLPGGADTDAILKAEVEAADLVAAVLSTASLASHYVTFELGARWGNGMPLIPLLAPTLPASALSRPLSGLNTLSCASAADMHQFVAESARILNLTSQPPASFQRHIDRIVSSAHVGAAAALDITGPERLLYSTVERDLGFDFKGASAQLWQNIDGKDQPVSGYGKGSLEFADGQILNLRRTNDDGRFEIWLNCYFGPEGERTSVAGNDLLSGLRRFRVDCEAKATDSEHTLRFVLRSDTTKKWVANDERTVSTNTWTPIKVYFQVPPNADFRLRIDDLNVSRAPSSVQIRNLRLVERTTEQ
ncbi:toll/interleukin-1 receptor domain-containing protein [Variovorax sp. J22R115]|uniref:toll/interleukin-1 receptor domain-containing protein n=1 Tax=Variovorax sp. J22R115 TaxID=3053509 RepID=UPI002577A347|nr:toll/interleukin-1 receptor domain-containing protein [Variovorax sp. J22R115]MDM0054010.1 toll/interleukin-1 receptor domain-containing protein [Variovorax sp. J22R115]